MVPPARERTAHLWAPAEPGPQVDVLHSRVAGNPDLGPRVTAQRRDRWFWLGPECVGLAAVWGEFPDLGYNAVADVEYVYVVLVDDLALALAVGVVQGVDPLVASGEVQQAHGESSVRARHSLTEKGQDRISPLLCSGQRTAARTVPDRVLGEQAMERGHVPGTKRRVTGPYQLYVFVSAHVSSSHRGSPGPSGRGRGERYRWPVLAVYRGLLAAIGVSADLMHWHTEHTGRPTSPGSRPWTGGLTGPGVTPT